MTFICWFFLAKCFVKTMVNFSWWFQFIIIFLEAKTQIAGWLRLFLFWQTFQFFWINMSTKLYCMPKLLMKIKIIFEMYPIVIIIIGGCPQFISSMVSKVKFSWRSRALPIVFVIKSCCRLCCSWCIIVIVSCWKLWLVVFVKAIISWCDFLSGLISIWIVIVCWLTANTLGDRHSYECTFV